MSDFSFNSDDLNLDGDNDGPSKTKIILGVVAALFVFGVCVNAGEDPAPEPVAETAPAAIETVAEVEPEPEIEEEEVEAPPASSSTGDYSSTSEYTDEMIDSSQKLGQAFGTWAEATDAAANGAITPNELAQLARTFKTTIKSHYDFFNTRTPPDVFQDTNRLLLDALELYDEALDQAIICAEQMKESACMRSAELTYQGNNTVDRATQSINN